MQLEGRRIVVTGGARGIGAAIVRAYAAEGAQLTVLDVLDEPGEALVRAVTDAGPGSAAYVHCDISRRAEVIAAVDEAARRCGGLDVLANIAGVERSSPAESITDDEWDLIFAVNVRGTMLTNQAAFPHLVAAGGGRVINVGSDAGLVPFPNGAHYAASKSAVHAWTRTIAAEWGRHGITANCVIPAMWTPMYEAHRAEMSPDELAAHDAMMARLIPLGGRLGDPDQDLAPLLVFLAGPGARFITGQLLSVNGGLGNVR
jgi:NAD(P)-dependent dehydrogenase (short-subunit alcohol dehydrogenase family)